MVLTRRARTAASRLRDELLGAGNGRLGSLVLLESFRARHRRAWRWSADPPHFTDFRYVMLEATFGTSSIGSLTRFFLTREVIRRGDRILDIGFGDGFADRRFYSELAGHIDAVDIESDAVEIARAHNAAPNIAYLQVDATKHEFPAPPYDVIIWDGAIGHFPPDSIHLLLERIKGSLAHGGVFVGSESLGRSEGAHDHLTYFDELKALAETLHRVFPHVVVRESEYRIQDGFMRREGHWRCAVDSDRVASLWKTSRELG